MDYLGIMRLRSLKMKLVDAHVHLSDPEYTGHTDMLVEDAKRLRVVALVTNAMDYATSIEALKLRDRKTLN